MGINAYLVYYYYHTPQIFTTLIWLYWCQSVMMGMFNFLDILTVRTVKLMPATEAEQGPALFKTRVRTAFFFAFHYGFFHLVYLVFIPGLKPKSPVQWDFFKYFLIAFFVGQLITFIQHKIWQRKSGTSLGVLFITPYLRIVPMHLTILIPSFIGISNMGIFLILKAIADVLTYAITRRGGNGKEADAAMLASQQTINM